MRHKRRALTMHTDSVLEKCISKALLNAFLGQKNLNLSLELIIIITLDISRIKHTIFKFLINSSLKSIDKSIIKMNRSSLLPSNIQFTSNKDI